MKNFEQRQFSITYVYTCKIENWMDNPQIYVLFNNISVIPPECLDDNERLCAMEHR